LKGRRQKKGFCNVKQKHRRNNQANKVASFLVGKSILEGNNRISVIKNAIAEVQ
jgi:hypothetical protein